MGGRSIPDADVKRRFSRSLEHFLSLYAPLADRWTFQDNTQQPAALLFESAVSTLTQVREFLHT
jgi:predicted ABC-type ATPase